MGCRDLDWIGRRHLKTEDLVGEMRKEPHILFHHFMEGAREVPFHLSGGMNNHRKVKRYRRSKRSYIKMITLKAVVPKWP